MAICIDCAATVTDLTCFNGRCSKCHAKHLAESVPKPILMEPAEVRRQKDLKEREERFEAILVTSETSIEGVQKRLGLVTGHCVLGMNIFRDFTAEIRDVIGGRSGGYQKSIREAQDICIREMKQAAYDLGANAIIAVDLDFNEITGGGGLFGGKGMIMVAATGTAVQLEDK